MKDHDSNAILRLIAVTAALLACFCALVSCWDEILSTYQDGRKLYLHERSKHGTRAHGFADPDAADYADLDEDWVTI